ncbi:50S ribosomal protein L29 [Flammeovirgaceae bacterium SG7u.111]|nr:50S ribosomal protein L29 [Flammeovirgaceae bacterium SG7u.132]WPO35853.1 50S ribosomal protein L29 [Flammeovirgaceae bacterium SG7u.111]
MKNSEIKALTVEELKDKLAASEKSLQNLRFANSVSPLENPMQIKDLRKLITRLNTELHSKNISMVKEKIESGELTNFNARKFVTENQFGSPINLAKVKKIINQSAK